MIVVESDPEMIEAGKIGQVCKQFDTAVEIHGFRAPDPHQVTMLIVGKNTVNVEEPASAWAGGPLKLEAGSFAIALVKNLTDAPMAVSGLWQIEQIGKELAPPVPPQPPAVEDPWRVTPVAANASLPVPLSPMQLPTQAPVGLPPQFYASHVVAAVPAMPQVDRQARTIPQPGTNEVLVLLTMGECKRLAECVAEGRAVDYGERWSIHRKLQEAISPPRAV